MKKTIALFSACIIANAGSNSTCKNICWKQYDGDQIDSGEYGVYKVKCDHNYDD